jgi:hypothetical protein
VKDDQRGPRRQEGMPYVLRGKLWIVLFWLDSRFGRMMEVLAEAECVVVEEVAGDAAAAQLCQGVDVESNGVIGDVGAGAITTGIVEAEAAVDGDQQPLVGYVAEPGTGEVMQKNVRRVARKRGRVTEAKAPRKAGATAAQHRRFNHSMSTDSVPSPGTPEASNVEAESYPPGIAVVDEEIPNLYLGGTDPMEVDFSLSTEFEDPKVQAHSTLFYEQIELHYKTTSTRAMMSRAEMDAMVQLIKGNKKSKNSAEYKMRRDYAVISFGQHYSVVKGRDVSGKVQVDISYLPRYCCYEDLFMAIHKCHVEHEGHSGIRKTEITMKQHYNNTSRAMIEKFIATCNCQLDRKHPAKPDDVKPIISSTFNSRGQVDLINMTAYPDGNMKWILHYQDHHDKMSYLRALPDKEAKTVALELLPLFLMQGAPVILQSDNGREFVVEVIKELMGTWKDCHIVHGSPRHPQTQGSVERANADVETMVMQWMDDHDSTNWTWGIQFVAHKKNNRYHEGIKQIPYVLRYGQPCRVGLSRMNLPPLLISNLTTEEDLEAVINDATVLISSLGPVTREAAAIVSAKPPEAERTTTVTNSVLSQHGNRVFGTKCTATVTTYAASKPTNTSTTTTTTTLVADSPSNTTAITTRAGDAPATACNTTATTGEPEHAECVAAAESTATAEIIEGACNTTSTTGEPEHAECVAAAKSTATAEIIEGACNTTATTGEPKHAECVAAASDASESTNDTVASTSGITLRVGDVLFYRSHLFICGDQRGERVSAIGEFTNDKDYPILMENGEVLPSTQQVKLLKQLVDGHLIDYPHDQYWELCEYKRFSTQVVDRKRKSTYAVALEESMAGFRKEFQALAEKTGMPLDLLCGTPTAQILDGDELIRTSPPSQDIPLLAQTQDTLPELPTQQDASISEVPTQIAATYDMELDNGQLDCPSLDHSSTKEDKVAVGNTASGSTTSSSSSTTSSSSSKQPDDELDNGSEQSNDRGNPCCCGCGMDATLSNHYCSITGKRVMSWCYDPNQEMEDGFGSKGECKGCVSGKCCCSCGFMVAENSALTCAHTGKTVYCDHVHIDGDMAEYNKLDSNVCVSCYAKLAPPEGTPGRSELRRQSKEAMEAQGERMRKYARLRSNGNKSGSLTVGTVVRVKVDKEDRGKLDHKSVPGVIVEVTKHDNYRIACKGGLLKDCLGAQLFQVESVKQAEHYNLQNAFANWTTLRKISIREALAAISKMGGQGFFFCNCKGKYDKRNCKCRKNGRECNSKCHPRSTSCCNHGHTAL